MTKNKLLLLLALLMTAATGAWAQETPLVTINSIDYQSFTSGSKTFDDKVTVTFSNKVYNDGDSWGWYAESASLLTVAGTNGYTITSCKFYVEIDGTAMTGYTVEGESPSVYLYDEYVFTDANQSVNIGSNGITKIEVFGAASGSGSGEEAQTAKHLITATYREQTRLLEQPLPYATTVGELYEAVTGESFSDLMSTMSLIEMPLTGISSDNTSVVSVGALNGASTPVTVNADGKATVALSFSGYYQGIFVSAISPLYATLKDGVKDADKWTVKVGDGQAQALPIGGLKGDGSETVTLQYNGRLKVKGVKATIEAGAPAAGKTVDLSTLTADYEAQDGETLTGTLASNVKISIADGATVTLDGVTINGVNDGNYEWAGITCLGDATIILSGTNTVKGFYEDYPGIQAAADKTLIINGTGSLTASNYGYAAAIGGGNKVACGNIEIQGGTITATTGGRVAGIGGGHNASCGNITISGGTVTATGGTNGAGIGGGYNASWGNITISGGTVNATGGEYGAGIGGGKRGAASFSCGNIIISGGTVTATGGNNAPGIGGGRGNNNKTLSSCGDITIANTVTKVTATAGENAPNSIGAGYWGTCGTVSIGGVEGAITTSPYTYDPAAPAAKPAATVTTAPTGAAVVGVGKTTALVSGGVAEGGTLMYAVTTTNTKPTSTAGFSDAVPTAQTITASGKVYVWYYVKGDDTHSDSEIAATAIEVPVADIVWDATNVSDLGVFEGAPYEMDGVTMSSYAGNVFATWTDNGNPTYDGIEFQAYETGGYTFTAPAGKAFTKIEMKPQGPDGWGDPTLGTGWAYAEDHVKKIYTVTWKGSAASTVDLLKGTDYFEGAYVKSIVFYLSE